MKGRILLLDDDNLLLGFMSEYLTINRYETFSFSSPPKAMDFLEENSVDLVITDVKMNEMTGDEILTHILANHPETGVIMITGFGNINHCVNALKKGAYDYITKPFKAKELIFRVNRYFEAETEENRPAGGKVTVASSPAPAPRGSAAGIASREAEPEEEPKNLHINRLDKETDLERYQIIGNDPTLRKLLRLLPKIAKNDAPVMIQGESGTGKELFAHAIHSQSSRAGKPYVKINCANLPKDLVESTLFGHLKGSFTGAITDRKGAFHEADGGTLLLDEITEIDIDVQAKLLRVLQEKEFYRVGSQKPTRVDVRILATSNRDLSRAISNGEFREDLYYRLNVFPLTVPPLRERKGDIPLLAQHFIDRYSRRYNLPPKKPSEQLLEELMQLEWRGNVRELDNIIHRGVILSGESDLIEQEHIDNPVFTNIDPNQSKEILSDFPITSIENMELQLIRKTLEHTKGNQKKAARILGISDRTIRNKLKNAGYSSAQDLLTT